MSQRKSFSEEFRMKVAESGGHMKPDFVELARRFDITPKQAKHFWMEWQVKLAHEYAAENEKLKAQINRLRSQVRNLEQS